MTREEREGWAAYIAGAGSGLIVVAFVAFLIWPPPVLSTKTTTPTIPTTVTVLETDGNLHEWAIYTSNGPVYSSIDGSGFAGLTMCWDRQIFVDISNSRDFVRDTLIHELLHAGACLDNGQVDNLRWNSKTNRNHEGIYAIANYMSNLLYFNPQLTKYLSGETK